MKTLVTMTDLYVKYNQAHVLEEITLEVKERDYLIVIGPNGGGKSTLIKTILGFIKPCGGLLTVQEGLVMGYVPQHTKFDRQFPIRVEEVVMTGRLPQKIRPFYRPAKEDVKSVHDMLEQLGILALANRQIGMLSGGQLQKVLLARALVSRPELLILDEPTASLDAESRKEIYEILHEFNKEKTVILVTHDLEHIEDNRHQTILLNRKILYRGDSSTRTKALHGGKGGGALV